MLEVRIYHKESDEYVGLFPTDKYDNTFETVANNTNPCSYLTFDGDGINLFDNNLKFYEDGDYAGYTLPYISSENHGVNYDYAIEQTEPLTFDFSSVIQKPKKITILCKEACIGSYKTVITQNSNGTTITNTSTVLRHRSDKIVISLPENATKVELYFLSSLAPNQYIRITSIFYGTINIFNKFKSHNLIEEINVLSDDLPINQFEATIVNPSYIEFTKKDPLIVFNNNKYYGDFYITKFCRIAENLYDVVAQNLVGVLDGEEYADWVSNRVTTLSNFVDALSKKIIIEDETEYTLFGYIPIVKKRFALCAACWGCGLMVDGSRSTEIHLKKIPTEISSVILTKDRRIINDAILERDDPIVSASITYPSEMQFEYGEITLKSNADTVNYHVFDDAPIYITSHTGNVIYYGESDNYVEYESENDSVTFSYTKYKYYDNTENINNLVAAEKGIYEGNTKTYNNFQIRGGFYNDNERIEDISRVADVQKYIQSRGKVGAKIRLRNEKVGDLIQIETAWDGIITGIITKMDITFGYEDIANIEVLEWSL